MSRHTESLNIDPAAARRLAVAYTGYGEACRSQAEALKAELAEGSEKRSYSSFDQRQLETRLEQTRIVSASAFCIGASYYALIDAHFARIVYWGAAQAYRDLNMSYGAILAICAADATLEEAYWADFTAGEASPELSPADAAPMMLIAADMLVRDGRNARQALAIIDSSQGMEGALIGSAQIPMGFYHALANEARNIARGDFIASRSLLKGTVDFLSAWEQRLRLVQNDRFHWEHLHPQLLPVEPEVLAASIVVVRAARRADSSIEQSLTIAELPRPARVSLDIAIELSADETSSGERREYHRDDEPVIQSLLRRRRYDEPWGRNAF